MSTIWDILEIEPTKDEDQIKKAYRTKLVHANPEDHPEEFKALRQAYEQAVKEAQDNKDQGCSGQENGGKDGAGIPGGLSKESPIGRWLSEVEELYQDFYRRIDEKNWAPILSDDLCIGLESSDEARIGLLRFFMSHLKLPNKVWRAIDRTFNIVQDKKELYEVFPGEYIDYIVNLIKYENFLDYTLFEGDPEEDYDSYIDTYFSLRQAVLDQKTEEGKQIYETLTQSDIYHPFVSVEGALLARFSGDLCGARSVLEDLWGQYEDSFYIGDTYADILLEMEDFETAALVCERILEKTPQNYTASLGYARCLAHRGDYRQAKEVILDLFESVPGDEKAMEVLQKINLKLMADYRKGLDEHPGDQTLLLDLGWCMCQNEDYDQCLEILLKFEPDKDHLYDYVNLRGRIYLCLERYEEALPWLKQWREMILSIKDDGTKETGRRIRRIGYANYAIACCYSWLGEHKDSRLYDLALEAACEAIQTEEESRQRYNCIYMKAELFHKMGKEEACIDLCGSLIDEETGFFPAYILRQEACLALGLARQVIDDYYRAIRIYPKHPKPYELVARMFLDFQEEKEAMEVVRQARKVNVETDELRLIWLNCLRNLSQSREDYDQTLEYACNILKESHEERTKQWMAQVYRIMALCYLETGRYSQALEVINQAHSYSPMDNTILAVKARILECSGQSSEALALYLDLASCMPDSPFITQGIGRIYAERNELKKAIHYMRMTLALNPDYPQCHYLLGQLYKRSALAGAAGDWKRALEQMNLAVKEKDCVSHRMERGDIFFQMSNYRAAIDDFLWVLQREPENELAIISLAGAFYCMGDYGRALDGFKRCIRLSSAPPVLMRAYMRAACCCEKLGQVDEAVNYYHEGLKKFPRHGEFYTALGDLLISGEKYREAADIYLRGVELLPDEARDFADKICVSLILAEDKKSAKIWWKRLMGQKDPRGPYLGNLRAGQYYLYIENKPSRARKYFEKAAASLDGENEMILVCHAGYCWGCALAMAGNKAGAARRFYDVAQKLKNRFGPAILKDSPKMAPLIRLYSSVNLWLNYCRQENFDEKLIPSKDLAVQGLRAFLSGDMDRAVILFGKNKGQLGKWDFESEGMLRLLNKR
ncbi:tetratricopeptide (TPR) repeat protein [Catenibacillus scindens]|uniref:Tetratricopeptide (TPR) repeat protein n=1 Tax=Catenibacillus scindens TaxID=673271 RepID=A0A7W8M405_9FIRM|nr:tetratricopeptide repeat protein [Catenibacillus scindens]MBB5263077.1 tetratricopeptide (TPR) repeat protein [Catenibacillus scindens]